MWYFVYVLLSQKDKRMYLGYTNNVERRFQQHQNGEVFSTRRRRPLVLIHYEAYLSPQDALRREGYFKTTAGKRALKIMLRDFFNPSKKIQASAGLG
jgi:putative endonuclease